MKRALLFGLSVVLVAAWSGLAVAEDKDKKRKKEAAKPADRERGPMPAGGPAAMMGQNFERMDSNGDGAIDQQEFLAPVLERFQRLDSNENGTIDRQEMMASREQMMGMLRGPVGPPSDRPEGRPRPGDSANRGAAEDRIRQFMQIQRDDDGRIIVADLQGPMRERLGRLDTNSDGFIDASEGKQLLERLERAGAEQGRRSSDKKDQDRRERGRQGGERQGPQKPKRPADEPRD